MSRQGGFFSGGWSKVWDLVKDYGIYGPEALLKTTGLYLVPEQRNMFLSIFWGDWGSFGWGLGGIFGGESFGEWSRIRGLISLISTRKN